MKKILYLFLAIMINCTPEPQTPIPQPPPDTDYCKPGCEHLQQLTGRDGRPGCEEARVLELPGGEIVTCQEFCENTQKAGHFLYPSCWVKVNKCDEIEQYRKRSMPCEGH